MNQPLPPAVANQPNTVGLFQREPAVIIGATMGLLSAINAILLGTGAYDGGAAAAITGVLAALGVFLNSVIVRGNVVPLEPLHRLADAVEANASVHPDLGLRGGMPPLGPDDL